jgi:uncharacterized protein YqeY
MLLDEIQSELMTTRKLVRSEGVSDEHKQLAQEKISLLNTLVSDMVRLGKDEQRKVTEADTLKMVKTYAGRVEETLGYISAAEKKGPLMEKQEEDKLSHERQLAILAKYIPATVDEATLTAFISEVVYTLPEKSMKQMGGVMAKLKVEFSGNYDGTLASKLVKAALS